MPDKKIFVLINEQIAINAGLYLDSLPVDGTYEVTFNEIKKDKTLKQLGALFGLWVKYLADTQGDSEDSIHQDLKAKFLHRIYIMDPLTDEQEQWVELASIYQDAGEIEKLRKHAARISLSWAKLPQMKEYLKAVEQHYQAIGMPLPEIDKHYKHYRS